MEMKSHNRTDSQDCGIPLRLRPTDLRELLNSNMVVMHAQATAIDVSLTASVADNVPYVVRLDPAKVGWAIISLVGNALRYVRHGSRRTPGGAVTVAVTYDPAESAVAIEVRDDGPGIVPATASRLFNHDDPHGPSGLGLLLVHDIVVAHGGAIKVRSSIEPIGNGTSIRFTIPNR